MNLGELLLIEGKTLNFESRVRHFHSSVWVPDWYSKEFNQFNNQVLSMSSPTKPFKATDYFKYKSGYPHEITSESKKYLIDKGCKRDKLSAKLDIVIPKIDIQDYIRLSTNLISYTTPADKNFIRDITVYDDESHESLAFIYIISRKAQVIAAWSEPKTKGKYIIKPPKNMFKNLKYERAE